MVDTKTYYDENNRIDLRKIETLEDVYFASEEALEKYGEHFFYQLPDCIREIIDKKIPETFAKIKEQKKISENKIFVVLEWVKYNEEDKSIFEITKQEREIESDFAKKEKGTIYEVLKLKEHEIND